MKFNILKPALAALVLVGTACTANYLDINTNPYEPSEDDMQTDGYIIGSALTSLASTVVSTDVNTAQFTDVLLGGPMGGYYSTTGGFTRTIMNYNPTDDWTNVFMYSDRTIPVLYSNLRELKKVTDDPIVLAIADIIKVAAMHRVTDTYGPIPYSMIGENGQIQVPYDSQEKVYDKFFEELDAAIKVLTEHRTDAISAKADYIYGGSAEKWCKLANSLKLRLAMRIVYANEAKAREMAESAVNSEVGVITSNADNADVVRCRRQPHLRGSQLQQARRLHNGRRYACRSRHHLLHERLFRPPPREIFHAVGVARSNLCRHPPRNRDSASGIRWPQVLRRQYLDLLARHVDECCRGGFPEGRGEGCLRVQHGLRRGQGFL